MDIPQGQVVSQAIVQQWLSDQYTVAANEESSFSKCHDSINNSSNLLTYRPFTPMEV